MSRSGRHSSLAHLLGRADVDWRGIGECLCGSGLARPLLCVIDDPVFVRWTPRVFREALRTRGLADGMSVELGLPVPSPFLSRGPVGAAVRRIETVPVTACFAYLTAKLRWWNGRPGTWDAAARCAKCADVLRRPGASIGGTGRRWPVRCR